MNAGRSLRWALVGWVGLLFAVAFCLFGAVLNARVQDSLLARVDDALEQRARAVAAALEYDFFGGWELDLRKGYLEELAEDDGWYELRNKKGELIESGGDVPPPPASPQTGLRSLGDAHEYLIGGRLGSTIRVGRSIRSELDEIVALRTLTVGLGGGLFLLSLIGGWWQANRTLRPIEGLTRTAERISEKDLSGRIDPESLPVELRSLGATLNDAFDRLQRAFDRQARFTADASHELRTPLSVIRTQAELALRRDREPAAYREALRATLRSAEKMTRIVEQLLALARADAGDVEVVPEPVALERVVAEVVRDAQPLADCADVRIETRVEPGLRTLGNPTLLNEALSNLVTNALRHRDGPGGRVEIQLWREGASAVLRVRDDGPGIPEDALPLLFERFFQADPARSRAQGGSGLGLALTRWIVETHGGTIDVQSCLGQGSAFTIRLPTEIAEAA